jgi:hypothetical protein
MVRFKWSGFHNLAVSKLNEKSTRSEHLTAFIGCFERRLSNLPLLAAGDTYADLLPTPAQRCRPATT